MTHCALYHCIGKKMIKDPSTSVNATSFGDTKDDILDLDLTSSDTELQTIFSD